MAATVTIATRLDNKKTNAQKFQHDAVLNTNTIHDDAVGVEGAASARLAAKKVLKDAYTN